MAGLLDDDAALQEYLRRMTALPMGDERQISLPELRNQRALTALREELLTRPKPWRLPAALSELSTLSSPGAAPSEITPPQALASSRPSEASSRPSEVSYGQPQFQPQVSAGDLASRMTGPLSANIEDRRPEFTWRNVANWLGGPQ